MTKRKRVTLWLTGILTALALLAGGYVIVRDPDPQKMLSEACGTGNLNLAKVAVFCGADVNRHPAGSYPNLIEVSSHGHIAMMDFLLAKGASIEQKDKFGNTALCYAAQNLNLAAVEFLIAKGANPLAKNEGRGDTPAQFAKVAYTRLQGALGKPFPSSPSQ